MHAIFVLSSSKSTFNTMVFHRFLQTFQFVKQVSLSSLPFGILRTCVLWHAVTGLDPNAHLNNFSSVWPVNVNKNLIQKKSFATLMQCLSNGLAHRTMHDALSHYCIFLEFFKTSLFSCHVLFSF